MPGKETINKIPNYERCLHSCHYLGTIRQKKNTIEEIPIPEMCLLDIVQISHGQFAYHGVLGVYIYGDRSAGRGMRLLCVSRG